MAITSGAHAAAAPEREADQVASSAPQDTATDQNGAPDIIVTAQKKSESLQSVPAAVSVVGNERLESLGVTNLSQIGNLAPGISVTPVRSQAFIFIRGVGQTLTSPNADAAVATNLNGVYLPAEIAGTAFFDVDRVEILPGPQGTLYGRNSTGGVVNIVSRTPGETFAANGLVEVGNYGRVQVVAGVNVPALPHARVANRRHLRPPRRVHQQRRGRPEDGRGTSDPRLAAERSQPA